MRGIGGLRAHPASRTAVGEFRPFSAKLGAIQAQNELEAVGLYGLAGLGANLARSRASYPDRAAATCGGVPVFLLSSSKKATPRSSVLTMDRGWLSTLGDGISAAAPFLAGENPPLDFTLKD